jgi:hypothetical protein
MTDRIRFITHQGKQILLIDFSNCAASDVGKICREVPDFVTTLPRGSALLLSDFTGASFDEEAMRDMKQAAVFDKSHVRKSAWVGAENFPKVFSEGLRTYIPQFERVSFLAVPGCDVTHRHSGILKEG